MSRWDYDTVFYRVFCITLLAVAFTFTVVLTNVFVDIDGLLSKKDKNPTPKPQLQNVNDIAEIMNVNILPEDKSENIYDDKDYQDSNDLYRSKRSLDTPEFLFHVRDPKLKKILTNRLTLLLDELDDDETSTAVNNVQDHIKDIQLNKFNELHKLIHEQSAHNKDKRKLDGDKIDKPKEDKKDNMKTEIRTEKPEGSSSSKVKEKHNGTKKNDQEIQTKIDKKNITGGMETELLHLAMHNIVLQGIVGNMNLDDVYKKVADLVKKYESDRTKVNEEEFQKIFKETDRLKKRKEEIAAEKFTDEPIHFKDLHQDTDGGWSNKKHVEIIENVLHTTTTPKPRAYNLMIKTIIDITALNNDKTNKESDKSYKDISGVVKLIYNGKSMKFKRMEDDYIKTINNTNATETSNQNKVKIVRKNNHETDTDVTTDYFEKIIHNYLRKFPRGFDSSEHLLTRKRLKRHIKIHFDGEKTTAKPIKKKDDDELFVEIETHFDSKGAKGEQKKKMIKKLIQKIQKAIHSDKEISKKKSRHWHVKKRVQNPLGIKKAAFMNNIMLPLSTLSHRHLAPISKAVPLHEDMPLISDDSGRTNWHRKYGGPRFFGKAINSAEMSTVDIDYDKVMRHNGISQRLQKPLNTDISDEVLQNSSIYDLGNIKFLMKDIDGTGFAIGFNQYMDEAPDPETMKVFSGLQNIIQTYHQRYDQPQTSDAQNEHEDENYDKAGLYEGADTNEGSDYEKKENSGEHHIERRSIKESQKAHYHSNEYTKIFKNNFLPYHKYQDLFDPMRKHKTKARRIEKLKAKQANSFLIVDENIFEKNLKPGEILSIADLIERRKRSMKVKKISNVKIKNKVSRYLNTHTMASKSLFLNKKRNKRQIGKIRIVARDSSHPHAHRNSQEDFFVVSDEKIFADRAVVREVEVPEIEANDKMHALEHYDIISPQKEEDSYDVINHPVKVNDDHYDIVSPYTYDVPHVFDAQPSDFSRRARHNNLMSKYPHIFMQETNKDPDNPSDAFGYAQYAPMNIQEETTTQAAEPAIDDETAPDAQELAQLLSIPKDQNNYRVTVKIRPKNMTGVSGFKEVHTSINKSFNKNGLMYTSLTNVSQLSKVEKIDKNASRRDFESDPFVNVKQQQNIIKSLIKQHKSRIDEQLHQLYKEKEKLEKLNVEKLENMHETILSLPVSGDLNFPGRKNEVISKILKAVDPPLTEITTKATTTAIYTTTSLTPNSTNIVTYEATTENIDRVKLVNTIERNENITEAILKKIDQNTGLLQDFLSKLLDKMNITHKTEETTPHIKSKNKVMTRVRNEEPSLNHKQNNEPETKMKYDIPFNLDDSSQNMQNTFFKNLPKIITNHSGIPFLYAFQQPFDKASNKDGSFASVVYHGHIHTNAFNNNKGIYYKPEKPTDYYQQDHEKETYYSPEKKPDEYYKQSNKEAYYIPEKKPMEYYKPDSNKETYYKPEKEETEYRKQNVNKETYYKSEKEPIVYQKPNIKKEIYYKPEKEPSEYYKQNKDTYYTPEKKQIEYYKSEKEAEYMKHNLNKEAYYTPEKKTDYYKQDSPKERFYKPEKEHTEYGKQTLNKETYYAPEKKPVVYYKQETNKETYYKPEKEPTEYQKQNIIKKDSYYTPEKDPTEYQKPNIIKKDTFYTPEKEPTEYQKQNTIKKDSYYSPEKKPLEYFKQTPNKETFYKPDKKQNDYYKPDSKINDKIINPKPIKEVLKENVRNPTTEAKKDDEKDFWQPKPGEKVLHNFVMKNNTKFFIDETGQDFKIYSPISAATLNTTNIR